MAEHFTIAQASALIQAKKLSPVELTYRQIVAELNRRGIRTMRSGAWTAATVRKVLLRATV
jgi:hypothetical protein